MVLRHPITLRIAEVVELFAVQQIVAVPFAWLVVEHQRPLNLFVLKRHKIQRDPVASLCQLRIVRDHRQP